MAYTLIKVLSRPIKGLNMSDIDEENVNSSNDTTEEVVNTEAVEETVADTETEDSPKYTESEMKMYARTKKAEAEARQLKKQLEDLKATPKAEQSNVQAAPSQKQDGTGLTPLDAIAISKANIHEDDVDELVQWAKFKNLTIKDAIKDKTWQTIQRDKEEFRKTAQAANTGNARRGSSRPTPESLIDNALKGIYSDDVDALVDARLSQLKKS